MTCCKVKLSDLNRRVAFNQLVNTPDGQGGFSSSFTLFKTMWCKVQPMKGTEKVHSDRLNTTQLYKVTCRYFSGLLETMQAVYNGEALQIRSIVNIDEQNEYLEIMVERKAKAQ